MIKYQLRCDAEHEFEGWFRSSADYDAQAERSLLECPACGSSAVSKAIMAPAVVSGGEKGAAEARRRVADAVRRARDYVERNFDYVGEKFPEEARKIHYGEAEERRIYGEASGKEVRALIEEGVPVAPLPAGIAPTAAARMDRAGAPVPQRKAGKKPLN
ncbi:DUF1178 family protein [Amphiplicatus metriothermophilus]|uniref:Uncharacterized protein n=1 Tax=Amphiplicatus metriothermophilus TaxID=1519374 RepID=A0A239PSD9_9PROT|nr:DUF1178 family protein [Amphiplicatus metriothermophilus]MBB5519139.1 hypothetical protein [Amphiplicatus metriothermophilus]SNT73209.1 hypothetical protein SAMN06297382_1607 [Amphiplicatus metriothermophilus]